MGRWYPIPEYLPDVKVRHRCPPCSDSNASTVNFIHGLDPVDDKRHPAWSGSCLGRSLPRLEDICGSLLMLQHWWRSW